MKLISLALVSVTLLASPLVMASHTSGFSRLADVEGGPQLEVAALNLALKARVAKDFVEDNLLSGRALSTSYKAIRLTRSLNLAALKAADLVVQQASDDELTASLMEIQVLFFQVDATKRSLVRSKPSQRREIEATFNQIRTAFYVYKKELTGSYY